MQLLWRCRDDGLLTYCDRCNLASNSVYRVVGQNGGSTYCCDHCVDSTAFGRIEMYAGYYIGIRHYEDYNISAHVAYTSSRRIPRNSDEFHRKKL